MESSAIHGQSSEDLPKDVNWGDLPRDITDYIWSMVSPEIKVWTNKKDYEKYHYVIKDLIPKEKYESYIRDMVRNDCSYVLIQLLKENFQKWLKWKKVVYKGCIYQNYIKYLLQLCIEYNSTNSLNVIKDSLREAGLGKKWHKNNRIKDIKWSN